MTVRLQREDFDASAEAKKLCGGRTDIGAVVTFTGICRGTDMGAAIGAMTLEHYPGMAERELGALCVEARRRWSLDDVYALHRYGPL
ncbi:MAG TPA: molybdenum cofactor biosynthesis protein MoaE, partial [Xanthobacteraceae bacterium]|nr:molybdenum cofactor biosynthesis protein MoaE [Xanthobacteraceae bacterium]